MWTFKRSRFRQRILIVGAGRAGRTIYRALNEYTPSRYDLVGFIDDDPHIIGKDISIQFTDKGSRLAKPISLPVIADTENLLEIISQQRVTMIVWAMTNNLNGELDQLLTDSLQHDVEVVLMSDLYEQLTGKIPVEFIRDHWSAPLPIQRPDPRMMWKLCSWYLRCVTYWWSYSNHS